MSPVFLFPTTGEEWRHWLSNEGLTILSILFGLVVVWLALRFLVSRIFQHIVRRAAEARHQDPELAKRRTSTMVSAVNWGVSIILLFIGIVLVLNRLGLDVTAVITSAGLAGLGLTLGAQALVRDLINGTFILAENQYQVGDVVTVAGISGQVIDMNPRRTVLRDLDGNVHTVPNGAISVATNMTRDFSRINLNIGVAYEEDIGQVIAVINEECRRLQEERPGDFLSDPGVLRVDNLGDSSVDLKITADVRTFTQWDLTAQLRRRLKDRFDEVGIEIPYPHRTLIERIEQAAKADHPPE